MLWTSLKGDIEIASEIEVGRVHRPFDFGVVFVLGDFPLDNEPIGSHELVAHSVPLDAQLLQEVMILRLLLGC